MSSRGNTEPGAGLRVYAGATALVTGGASGIGAALGRELARRGASVVLADRDADDARAEALVADVVRRHGRLDHLFNNAGIAVGGEARDLRLEDWREAVEVNLLGVVHGIQAAWSRMIGQGFGHVVNTASMAAFLPAAMAAPYGATKSAVLGVSRALRLEGAPYGIRVSVLCPGVVRTPILDGGRHGRLRNFLPTETLVALNERLRPMDVDRFAQHALADVARNRGLIVYPRWWRILPVLNALAPWLLDALTRREYARVRALPRG